jgi:hypothetical protein
LFLDSKKNSLFNIFNKELGKVVLINIKGILNFSKELIYFNIGLKFDSNNKAWISSKYILTSILFLINKLI